jgi:hypothetical protein
MVTHAVEVLQSAEEPALVLFMEQDWVTETPTGLVFAEDTPLAVWAGLTTRLLRQRKVLEWAIADAINFGEAAYGEMYSQWVEETGLAKHTLTNIAAVGRRVELSRRRDNVSFSHHAEVAYLPVPDQEKLLDTAESAGWTRYELRDAVRERKDQLRGRETEPPDSLVWVPQKSDLTPEARCELERRLAGVGKRHAIGYERAWLDCLLYTDQQDAFTDWKGPTDG